MSTQLKPFLSEVADAIREREGSTGTINAQDFPARIKAIPSTSSAAGWVPQSDWWDIQSFVDSGTDFTGNSLANVRYGYVVSDSNLTITLAAGYEYHLSDGTSYTVSTDAVTHTWDRTQDKDCSLGYKTRGVIVCSDSRDVTISHRAYSLDGVDSIYIYLGDCNVTSIVCGNTAGSTTNQILQAVKCNSLATVTTLDANAFRLCYSLSSIDLPSGMASIGSNAFNGCYSLSNIEIPSSVVSIGTSAFSNYGLISVIIPNGFSLSLPLGQSANLSVASLEQIINNYADMTGQTAPTLTIGSTNIAKLSDEYVNLAIVKNITLT